MNVGTLWAIVECPVLVLACWTFSYHLWRLLGARSGLIWAPFLVLLAASLLYAWRSRPPIRGVPRRWFTNAVLGVALLAGSFTLLNSKPDADDASFFHRALAQLQVLDEPFFPGDTIHGDPTLPGLSPLHVQTSYEFLMSMTGHALHIDPLWFYQNAAAFAAAVVMTLVFALTFRHLGLRPGPALAATAAALAFLLLDGNLHRSFGNFSIVRFWQGKCILSGALMPLSLLMSYRFLRRPSLRSWLMLALAGVAAVGLSGTGVVLFPVAVACAALAWLLSGHFTLKGLQRAALTSAASIYCLAIGAAFITGAMGYSGLTGWDQWEPVWWRNLYTLVIGSPWILLRDAFLLLVVPPIALPPGKGWFIAAITIAALLLFANPLTAPAVLKTITPGVYWRLAYILPLPLCAGLAISCFFRKKSPVQWTIRPVVATTIRAVVATTAVVVTTICAVVATTSTVFADSTFKRPSDLKLDRRGAKFSRAASPFLAPGEAILVPEALVPAVALLNPDLHMVASRNGETQYVFDVAHRHAEGLQRTLAQQFITDGQETPAALDALRACLARGLAAIVPTSRALPAALHSLDTLGAKWTLAKKSAGYTLVLLEPFAPPQSLATPPHPPAFPIAQ